jgi:propionyl-CoA carboxylase beta chain
MGPDGAVNIVYRNQIQQAADPAAARASFIEEYKNKFANPFKAAELGFIDEVIHPRVLRQRLGHALDFLSTKRDDTPRRKHGNIPL